MPGISLRITCSIIRGAANGSGLRPGPVTGSPSYGAPRNDCPHLPDGAIQDIRRTPRGGPITEV
jgi:hypothetical protein